MYFSICLVLSDGYWHVPYSDSIDAETGSMEWMYLCMYVFIYVCMYVCMYACMYVRTYVCMSIQLKKIPLQSGRKELMGNVSELA